MSGSYIFGRHTKAQLTSIVDGENVWLIDSEGKRYIDASGGAACFLLKHTGTL